MLRRGNPDDSIGVSLINGLKRKMEAANPNKLTTVRRVVAADKVEVVGPLSTDVYWGHDYL
jgi:hypothetical protein